LLEKTFDVYDKMNKIRANFAVGLSINLVKEFYIDFGFQYLTFFNAINFFEPRFALERNLLLKSVDLQGFAADFF